MGIIARLRFGERVSARQERYDLGSSVTIYADFRDDLTDALTAVSGVAFVVLKADGSVLSPAPSVITDAAGTYRCVLTPDQPGLWQISVSSTTSGTTVDRREFLMVSDVLPPTDVQAVQITQATAAVVQAGAQAAAAARSAADAASLALLAGSFTTKAAADAAIAGFTEGQTVDVTSDPNTSLIGAYARRSGVWVKISDVTLAGLGARVQTDETAAMRVALTDIDKRPLLGQGDDGRIYEATPAGLWPRPPAMAANSLGAGGRASWIGSVTSYPGSVTTAAKYAIRRDHERVLYVVLIEGQSLAGGANDDPLAEPISTTPTYPGYALMPKPGVKPLGVYSERLADLIEEKGTGYDSGAETVASGIVNGLIARSIAQLSVTPRIVALISSQGGRCWAQLGPGNVVYEDKAVAMAGIQRYAEAQGLICIVCAQVYIQGEQDRSSGLPLYEIIRNRQDMARHSRALTRMVFHTDADYPVFISQPNNGTDINGRIPPNMIAPVMCDGIDNIHVLPGHYFMTPSNTGVNTGVHGDSQFYLDYGGIVAEAVWDGFFGPGYTAPLFRRFEWVSPTQVDLFVSLRLGRSLVLDLSGDVVTPPTWSGSLGGVQIFDRGGSGATVTALEVLADTNIVGSPLHRLRVTFSTAILGHAFLHYATRNDGAEDNSGREFGPRGCLRDDGTPAFWLNSQVVDLGVGPRA